MAEERAADVAELRAGGLTMEKLAAHFGKTVPTIRASLKYAAQSDETVKQLPTKMPRRRWHEDHAVEVAALRAEGLSTRKLAEHFGKSEPTIRKALQHAAEETNDATPDSDVSGDA